LMIIDRDLMDRVRAGDDWAFETLMGRYGPGVKARVMRLVRDGAVADDVVQEVFLRLWTKADQWEGRGSVAGWLALIGVNLALNHLRTVRRRRETPLEPPEDQVPEWLIDTVSPGPAEIAESEERRELLRAVLERLPNRDQEVIRMVHEGEMDISEVAAALGVPSGTVKSRLHYARQKLAKGWKDLTEEGGDE